MHTYTTLNLWLFGNLNNDIIFFIHFYIKIKLKIFRKKYYGFGGYPCGYPLDIKLISNPPAYMCRFQFIILNLPAMSKITLSGRVLAGEFRRICGYNCHSQSAACCIDWKLILRRFRYFIHLPSGLDKHRFTNYLKIYQSCSHFLFNSQ